MPGFDWILNIFSKPKPVPGPVILYLDLFHNTTRIKYSVPSLVRNDMLMAAAKNQAEWMAQNQRLSHTTNGGLVNRVKKAGYFWSTLGENIAEGNTERTVYDMWMQSDGHLANIKNDAYTEFGYANSKNVNGRTYWCVVFGSQP